MVILFKDHLNSDIILFSNLAFFLALSVLNMLSTENSVTLFRLLVIVVLQCVLFFHLTKTEKNVIKICCCCC